MNRHDQFVLLVQTFLLTDARCKTDARNTVYMLSEAMKVPGVAIPTTNVFQATWEWIEWRVLLGKKPAWVTEHEENEENRVVLEQLEGDPVWWRNAEHLIDGATVPKPWLVFVTGRNRLVEMSKREADEFEKWARDVPGWSDDEPPLRRVSGNPDD